MHFLPNEIYHVYNRSNYDQPIFKTRANYFYFLEKLKNYIFPIADILNWCLMSNHFHLLLFSNKHSTDPLPNAKIPTQLLTEGVRLLLSSYSKGFNKQINSYGNLFQQKTQAKCLSNFTDQSTNNEDLSLIAFNYIHQDPLLCDMVEKIEDWEFSSFRDYLGMRKGNLCNRDLASQLLDFNEQNFYEQSYRKIPKELLTHIF